MNHLIVFSYVVILLITGSALLLSVLARFRHADNLNNLNYKFFLYLFLYQAVDFVFYYKGYIVLRPSVAAFFSFLSAVLFVLYHYYLILYLHELNGGSINQRVLRVICALYTLIWLLRSILFLDDLYVETMRTGNSVTSFFDCVMVFVLIGYLAFILYQTVRNRKSKCGEQGTENLAEHEANGHPEADNIYILKQGSVLLLYLIYFLVSSILIDIGIYNLGTWPAATYFFEVFLYALVGINGMIYLLRALREEENGTKEEESGRLVSQEVLDQIAEEYSLSPREKEVFYLLSDGVTNQDISDRLCISINTTKKHVNSIYRKLNINSRTNLLELLIHENDADRRK